MMIEKHFDNFETLITSLINDSLAVIQQALTAHHRCSLLLSGGSTPAPFYQQLAKQHLPWANIDIGLVDERWVNPEHAASNEKLLRHSMLIDNARAATYFAMKNNAATALQGETACDKSYQGMAQPALTILGMGNDGHTASLFPYAQGLEKGLAKDSKQYCVAITATASEVTGDNIERMSLTINAIKRSQYIALILCGDSKWKSYKQAKILGEVEAMPVRALLHDPDCCVNVYACHHQQG